MTDKQQPEALRLANVCSNLTRYSMDAHLIAAYLRSQYAELETLRAGYTAARLEIESLKAQLAAQQPGTAYATRPLVITSAPERIWLDLGFDPCEEDAHFSNLHDLTWSADNATGDGIEYVRADRAAQVVAQAAPVEAAVQQDAGRWRRLVNASELSFPVATIADDPENGAVMLYGRKALEDFVDHMDEIPNTYDAARAAQEGK